MRRAIEPTQCTHFAHYCQRCPLNMVILKAKLLNMGEPKAILGRAMDPPLIDDIERTAPAERERVKPWGEQLLAVWAEQV